MRLTQIRFPLLALIGILSALGLEAERIIVPIEFDDQLGNRGRSVSGFQQVTASSQFASASAPQILITGVAFRLDETSTRSLDYILPVVRIDLGTFRGHLTEMTPFVSDNFGPDRTRVFTRTDHPLFAPLGEGPASFRLHFSFDQPFYYDRNAGHLLIYFLGSGPIDYPAGMDWHESIEFRDPQVARVSLPGGLTYGGVIMEFFYSPVPEPRISILFLMGLGGAFLRRRLR